jgi:transcriptional regulator with XRE-family HTH domain
MVISSGMPARRELAALITAARRERMVDGRRMSQAALAALLGCTQSKVQKIEAAQVRIDSEDVEQIIEHLHIEPAPAAKMRQLAALNTVGKPWSGQRALVPPYARKYLELEQVAAEILSWHEMRIPGPLQSMHFMLRQFNTAGNIDIAAYVRNREQRRKLFQQPQLRRYHCILAEEALRRAVCGLGQATVRDQIDYLAAINDPTDARQVADARTSISLLPAEAAVPYLENDFSLLRFANPAHSVVYIEHVAGAQYLDSASAVDKATAAWHAVAQAALDREGTQRLLRKLRAELTGG